MTVGIRACFCREQIYCLLTEDLPLKHELKEKIAMPSVQKKTYTSVINAYMNGIQPNMLVTIMNLREV